MQGNNTNLKNEVDKLINTRVINGDTAFDIGELQNNEEIMLLMDFAYEMADELSPTGTRSPHDIKLIESTRKQLEDNLARNTQDENSDKEYSKAWQLWAEQQRKKSESFLTQDKREKMNRLQDALKNPKVQDLLKKPKVQDLLLKIMTRQMTPQQTFGAVTKDPYSKKQMMGLTLKRTKIGGKSRVFRRKNKKMTSTSRRKVRGTRRHRKSYSRRSTRK